MKLVGDILFFKNYLLGEGPFSTVSSTINLRDVIRFYRYRNGYFLTLLRCSEQLDKCYLGWLPRILLNILFSSDISSGVSIGPCYFPHPFGIVIGGDVSIKGPVVIFNDINLGKAHPGLDEKMPTLEGNVIISCGARLLGGISVGSNVVVGANAVLSKDLAGGSTFINNNKIIESVYFLK